MVHWKPVALYLPGELTDPPPPNLTIEAIEFSLEFTDLGFRV